MNLLTSSLTITAFAVEVWWQVKTQYCVTPPLPVEAGEADTIVLEVTPDMEDTEEDPGRFTQWSKHGSLESLAQEYEENSEQTEQIKTLIQGTLGLSSCLNFCFVSSILTMLGPSYYL